MITITGTEVGIGLCVIIFVILAYLFYRWRKSKAVKEKMMGQQINEDFNYCERRLLEEIKNGKQTSPYEILRELEGRNKQRGIGTGVAQDIPREQPSQEPVRSEQPQGRRDIQDILTKIRAANIGRVEEPKPDSNTGTKLSRIFRRK